MPDPPTFGSQWWEQHYRDHEPGRGLPSVHLVDEVAGLPVGTALDAGCGTGADALWLAEQGWRVTAIDISPTVVDRAERWALDEAPEAAARIAWEVADLTAWDPATPYDLVVSQYVHPDVPFADFVARLAAWVAPARHAVRRRPRPGRLALGGTRPRAGVDRPGRRGVRTEPRPVGRRRRGDEVPAGDARLGGADHARPRGEGPPESHREGVIVGRPGLQNSLTGRISTTG